MPATYGKTSYQCIDTDLAQPCRQSAAVSRRQDATQFSRKAIEPEFLQNARQDLTSSETHVCNLVVGYRQSGS